MKDVILYSRLDNHHTILEIWGGSTKHPDTVFVLDDEGCKQSNFVNNPFIDRQSLRNTYQWLCSVQSALLFPLKSLDYFITGLTFERGVLC